MITNGESQVFTTQERMEDMLSTDTPMAYRPKRRYTLLGSGCRATHFSALTGADLFYQFQFLIPAQFRSIGLLFHNLMTCNGQMIFRS